MAALCRWKQNSLSAGAAGRSATRVSRVGPFRLGEGVLDHQRVHEPEAALQDLQAEHGQFLFLAPVGGQLAALAEVDVVLDAVVVLHDVEPCVDLPLQVAVDLLDAGQQVEVQQPGDAEPDE